MTTGFALYRMPYAKECTLLTGEVLEVQSCVELNEHQGFVVAPFQTSLQEPCLMIKADKVEAGHDDSFRLPVILEPSPAALYNSQREDYHIDFVNFHAHLTNHDFQKLVLSRNLVVPRNEEVEPIELFRKACKQYPRMFIVLVYTPQSGCWLVATPETLLSGECGHWQTMALAGTTTWQEDIKWGDKDIQEQRYVATYITRQLEQFTDHFSENGPYTARAGHLAHLRSDFRFTMSDETRVGELLNALHPTPAVCGLPKDEARRFILQNEHHQRSYYSGFMGPLAIEKKTHLFVTLRCMQLFSDAYCLCAGGGLLIDSVEKQEWQETENKLDTMRNIISRQPGA